MTKEWRLSKAVSTVSHQLSVKSKRHGRSINSSRFKGLVLQALRGVGYRADIDVMEDTTW
jgi:hypothetical protein